jgi:hypothetical protein
VVVPYDTAFDKLTAHPSGIYYGASLGALVALAARKGYVFVGCSSGGVNAFFIRRDRLPEGVAELPVREGYVEGQHAEMREPGTGIAVKAILEVQRDLLLSLSLVHVDEKGFT